MQAALLYYRGSGPVAWWIRRWTKSKFSHVAPVIVFDDSWTEVYDAYWASGVTRREGQTGEADDIQILPFDDAKIAQKFAWLEQQVGKPYDKPSIIIIGLTKRLPGWLHVYVSRQGEWICSRLAGDFADLELDVWGLNGPPSPEDVHRIVQEKLCPLAPTA